MPRYFLTLTSKTGSRMPNDPEPQEHANIEAARAEAVKGIREMAAEAISSGRSDLPIETIDITDEEGSCFSASPVSWQVGLNARELIVRKPEAILVHERPPDEAVNHKTAARSNKKEVDRQPDRRLRTRLMSIKCLCPHPSPLAALSTGTTTSKTVP